MFILILRDTRDEFTEKKKLKRKRVTIMKEDGMYRYLKDDDVNRYGTTKPINFPDPPDTKKYK